MMEPGQYYIAKGDIETGAGRKRATIQVANSGDRPVQVGSHAHFFEANRALLFDRAASYGYHLDIPAGTSVRFEPGDSRTVELVEYAGARIVFGFGGLVNGPLDKNKDKALERAKELGYGGA